MTLRESKDCLKEIVSVSPLNASRVIELRQRLFVSSLSGQPERCLCPFTLQRQNTKERCQVFDARHANANTFMALTIPVLEIRLSQLSFKKTHLVLKRAHWSGLLLMTILTQPISGIF